MFALLFLLFLLLLSSTNATKVGGHFVTEAIEVVNRTPSNEFSQQNIFADQLSSASVPSNGRPTENATKKAKKIFTYRQKFKIIERFDGLKKKYRSKSASYSNRQLEVKVAKLFDLHSSTINRWKRQLCISRRINTCSHKEKLEFIKKFDKLKSKFPAKSPVACHRKIDEKICKKLGVCRGTIGRWKKEFGLSLKRNHTEEERFEIVKRYHRIKRKDPKQRNIDIAELLNISETSLRNWRREFEEHFRT